MYRYIRIFILPFLILAVGTTWSYLNYIKQKEEQFNLAQSELDLRREKVITNVKEKLKLYEYGLRGLRGAILTSKKINFEVMQTYARSRNFAEEFPGSLGFGFIRPVKDNELKNHMEKLSREYKREIKFKSLGINREVHYIIDYIEPNDVNRAAIGLDIASENKRYQAAINAMELHEPVLTETIKLVQDNIKQPGFLYLLPVFESGNKLLGWTYAPIILSTVFEDLMHPYSDELEIEIYSEEIMSQENLIFDSNHDHSSYFKKSISVEGQFKVGHKIWSYYIATLPKFNNEFFSDVPRNYLAVSLLITFLIASIILALQFTLIRAKKLAERMTISYKRSKDEADEALKIKSEFLATMSHEIRTPLNGVLGLTEILKETELNNEQANYVENIYSAGKTLKVVIDDILDFSKIEADKMYFENKEFLLHKLVNDVRFLFKKNADDKNIPIEISIDPEIPLVVVGDEFRIRQVLSNLVNNAIKFTESGSIKIQLSLITQNNNECKIVFSVIDTGIGIAPEVLGKLFSKFTQADSSMTRKFGGTGLGLAISKMLVEKMGGQIWVESRVGVGSQFNFSLSFKFSTAIKEEVINEHFFINENLNVLIVEDNDINILVTKKFIEKYIKNISIAKNGIEAVDIVKKKNFDIIFMDCQMPFMDGYQATQEIRKIETKRQYIVALSANINPEDKDKCIAAGMDDFLGKPIKKNLILSILSKVKCEL